MSPSPASSSCCASSPGLAQAAEVISPEHDEQVDGNLVAACFTRRIYLPVPSWVQEDRQGDELDFKPASGARKAPGPQDVELQSPVVATFRRLTLLYVSGEVMTHLFLEVGRHVRVAKERIQAKLGYPVYALHLLALAGGQLLDEQLIPDEMHSLTLVLDSFDPSDALLQAARHGYESGVRALLSRESDAERRREMLQAEDEQWERTPLLWAAFGGKNPAVEALLEAASSAEERDAMLQALDVNLWSPLHWAAYNGKRALCSKLLGAASTEEYRSALLEEQNDAGETAVDLALQQGGSPVLPLLFEHCSCQHRRRKAVALLCWRDADGRSLLHYVPKGEAFLALLALPKNSLPKAARC